MDKKQGYLSSALASSTLSPDSFYLLNPFSRASLYLLHPCSRLWLLILRLSPGTNGGASTVACSVYLSVKLHNSSMGRGRLMPQPCTRSTPTQAMRHSPARTYLPWLRLYYQVRQLSLILICSAPIITIVCPYSPSYRQFSNYLY